MKINAIDFFIQTFESNAIYILQCDASRLQTLPYHLQNLLEKMLRVLLEHLARVILARQYVSLFPSCSLKENTCFRFIDCVETEISQLSQILRSLNKNRSMLIKLLYLNWIKNQKNRTIEDFFLNLRFYSIKSSLFVGYSFENRIFYWFGSPGDSFPTVSFFHRNSDFLCFSTISRKPYRKVFFPDFHLHFLFT